MGHFWQHSQPHKVGKPGFGDILPFFSGRPSKVRVRVAWGLSVGRHLQASPEMLDWLPVRLLVGALNDTRSWLQAQGHCVVAVTSFNLF